MKTDNGTAQMTVDHLGAVILNVVRMNKPWKQEDLKQLGNYVKSSSISLEIQKPILISIVEAAEEAARDEINKQ